MIYYEDWEFWKEIYEMNAEIRYFVACKIGEELVISFHLFRFDWNSNLLLPMTSRLNLRSS
jgi:hypothetical protein